MGMINKNGEAFDTLTEAIAGLQQFGYTVDFNLRGNCIACEKGEVYLSPGQFKIDEIFRFEGTTDPSDQMILYAISSPQLSIKGILVNAYGVYSDTVSDEMARKLVVSW